MNRSGGHKTALVQDHLARQKFKRRDTRLHPTGRAGPGGWIHCVPSPRCRYCEPSRQALYAGRPFRPPDRDMRRERPFIRTNPQCADRRRRLADERGTAARGILNTDPNHARRSRTGKCADSSQAQEKRRGSSSNLRDRHSNSLHLRGIEFAQKLKRDVKLRRHAPAHVANVTFLPADPVLRGGTGILRQIDRQKAAHFVSPRSGRAHRNAARRGRRAGRRHTFSSNRCKI